MRAALIFALLLPGLAAQQCASPKMEVCMETCYPDHRHDNVDEDCCSTREWAWCAEGYRLVKSDEVCGGSDEFDRNPNYKTCCVQCADDEEECDNGPGDDTNSCPSADAGAIIALDPGGNSAPPTPRGRRDDAAGRSRRRRGVVASETATKF